MLLRFGDRILFRWDSLNLQSISDRDLLSPTLFQSEVTGLSGLEAMGRLTGHLLLTAHPFTFRFCAEKNSCLERSLLFHHVFISLNGAKSLSLQ